MYFCLDRIAREVVRGPHALIGQDRGGRGGGEHREDQGQAFHVFTVMQPRPLWTGSYDHRRESPTSIDVRSARTAAHTALPYFFPAGGGGNGTDA